MEWTTKKFSGVVGDLQVLRNIWFKKLDGESHAERLENFYKNQAHACMFF